MKISDPKKISPQHKLENGLLKLVQSLEQKIERGEWTDYLMIKESNTIYGDG